MLPVQSKTHIKAETLLLRGLQEKMEAGINAEEARIRPPQACMPDLREVLQRGPPSPLLDVPAQSL